MRQNLGKEGLGSRLIEIFNNIMSVFYSMHLGLKFRQDTEVHLEVSGQDGLDDEEAQPLQLWLAEEREEIVFRGGGEEVPAGGGVMVLQHRAIVVENSLQGGERCI